MSRCKDDPDSCDYTSNQFYRFQDVEEASDVQWEGLDSEFASDEFPLFDFALSWCEWSITSIEEMNKIHGVGDFDGDGRLDIIGSQYIEGKWEPSAGDCWGAGTPTASFKEKYYVMKSTDQGFEVIRELGTKGIDYSWHGNDNNSDPHMEISVVDVNGDGLSDVMVREGDASDRGDGDAVLQLYLSNGRTLNDPVSIGTYSDEDDLTFTDYNMDGFQDLLVRSNSYKPGKSTLRVYYWNPNTDGFKYDEQFTVDGREDSVHLFVDFTGDGVNDRLSLVDSKLQRYPFVTEGYGGAEVIDVFNAGQGNTTVLEYEPLSNSDHYARIDVDPGASATEFDCFVSSRPVTPDCVQTVRLPDRFYRAVNFGLNTLYGNQRILGLDPSIVLNGPMYVVTSASTLSPSVDLPNLSELSFTDLTNVDNFRNSASNLGGASNVEDQYAKISYYYSNARAQAGIGFLGFHTLKTVDEQTGVATVSTYRQDFPFIGTPLTKYVFTPSGDALMSEAHSVFWIDNFPDYLQNWEDLQNSQEWAAFRETLLNEGAANLGALRLVNSQNIQVTYRSESSLETGGRVEMAALNGLNTRFTCETTLCEFNYSKAANDQEILQQIKTITDFDEFGNAINIDVFTLGEDLSKHVHTTNMFGDATVNLHDTDLSYSQLGRLSSTTIERSKNGVAAESRYTEFTYYANGESNGFPGMLKTEVMGAGAEARLDQYSQTTYEYDVYGNTALKSIEGWDGISTVTRSSRSEYDDTGRYVDRSINGLGHVVQEVIQRNTLGAATTTRGLNGIETYADYDEWGREIFTASNDGSWASTRYVRCPSAEVTCPANAVTAIIKDAVEVTGHVSVGYLDALGREVRTSTLSPAGKTVIVDREFDVLGKPVRVSEPYFSEDSPSLWTRQYYDELGNPILTLLPNSSVSYVANSGYTVSKTNDLGHTTIERSNGLGELIEVIDNVQGVVRYEYDIDGSVKNIIVLPTLTPSTGIQSEVVPGLCEQPMSHQQTVFCYDELGRKTAMWDPDKGHWQYEYNAFGELIKQTDAKGQVVEIQFDLLGRKINRTDYASSGAIEGYTAWKYDTESDGNPAAGLLTQVVYTEGQVSNSCTGSNYCEAMHYDSIGRLSRAETTMPDGNTYVAETTYDDYGRVQKQTNALSGILKRNGQPVESGVWNEYNDFGALEYIENLEDEVKIFEPQEYSARGQLKLARLGGAITVGHQYYAATGLLERKTAGVAGMPEVVQDLSYVWDNIGNLYSRTNASPGIAVDHSVTETFCYDALNRLKGDEDCDDIQYDALGNITYKEGVGDYVYERAVRGGIISPHAVSAIKVNDSVVRSFQYDDNGNVINDGERSFIYTTFDKPLEIAKGGHTTSFKYGPGRARIMREDSGSASNKATWYLGNIEKIVQADGTVEWRRQLKGGGIYTYYTDANGNEISNKPVEKRYLLSDHLGSSDLILNQDGSVAQVQSFDPWGHRRDAQTQVLLSSSALANFNTDITTRGYTSHEMLDEVGLIHMNGRIYDPLLGRFLQADPFVQAVKDTQSYNRYSYVRNNPLNATDPSGFFFEPFTFLASAFIGYTVSGIAQSLDAPWLNTIGNIVACSAGSSACAGYSFGSTYQSTGSFSKSLESAAIAFFSVEAYTKIGKHFGTDGVGQKTQAPGTYKFGKVYLKPHQIAQQIGAHAVVGGVVADLQGGKFAHGFWSAGVTKGIMGAGSKSQFFEDIGFVGRTIVAALLGGTSSKLSGGKFENGAVTAAIAHMYNAEGKEEPAQKETSLYDWYKELENFYEYLEEANPVELAAWEEYSQGKYGDWDDPKTHALAIEGFDKFVKGYAVDRLNFLADKVNNSISTGLPKDLAAEGLYGLGIRSTPLVGMLFQASSAIITIRGFNQ